jgi:hypothetical protein
VCLGMLALVAAFHLGARCGSASIVDHSTTGIIAFDGYSLMDNGDVWVWVSDDTGWNNASYLNPPVPISEIKFWRHDRFITFANEIWKYDEPMYPGWHNYGPPGGATLTQSTTWGQIKAGFGE